jgi:hypothetical protein
MKELQPSSKNKKENDRQCKYLEKDNCLLSKWQVITALQNKNYWQLGKVAQPLIVNEIIMHEHHTCTRI